MNRELSQLSKAELITRLEAAQSVREGSDSAQGTALAEAEERMRAILATAVEGIITIDDRGLIESVNPAAERLFGYASAELVGRNVNVLMPAPYKDEHDQYLANYRQSGRPKIIGIGREVVGQRKDGTVFPLDLSVSEVKLSTRRLFTGFLRDVTDRKRAELRQRLQYATVGALAESTSLSEGAPRIMQVICEVMGWSSGEFWAVDREADIVHHVESWSPGEGGPSGLDPSQAHLSYSRGVGLPGRVWGTGKPEWIVDVAEDASFLRGRAAAKQGLRGAVGFPILLGVEVLGVMIFFSKAPNRLDEEALRLLASVGSQIGQFIERKRAESKLEELARTLAEKNKELETVVYVASHDLRSPLVNIQGFSRELAHSCEAIQSRMAAGALDGAERAEVERLLAHDVPEALEFILAGVQKIDALLTGFLRFSRLGRAALNIGRIDMNALLSSVARTMDFQVKQSGAKLQLEPLPDCLGDQIQINQVFSNLLDNAIKYLDPKRPGRILVRAVWESGRVIYSVQDNGIGIAPEHQGKVFEIFHRLDPSFGQGEGLGLTIAQRILERQSGRIWLESTPGEGSTFFVSLPAVQATF